MSPKLSIWPWAYLRRAIWDHPSNFLKKNPMYFYVVSHVEFVFLLCSHFKPTFLGHNNLYRFCYVFRRSYVSWHFYLVPAEQIIIGTDNNIMSDTTSEVLRDSYNIMNYNGAVMDNSTMYCKASPTPIPLPLTGRLFLIKQFLSERAVVAWRERVGNTARQKFSVCNHLLSSQVLVAS